MRNKYNIFNNCQSKYYQLIKSNSKYNFKIFITRINIMFIPYNS